MQQGASVLAQSLCPNRLANCTRAQFVRPHGAAGTDASSVGQRERREVPPGVLLTYMSDAPRIIKFRVAGGAGRVRAGNTLEPYTIYETERNQWSCCLACACLAVAVGTCVARRWRPRVYEPAAGFTPAASFRNAERAASVARGAAPRHEAGTDHRPLGHVPHMTCRALRACRMRMPHTYNTQSRGACGMWHAVQRSHQHTMHAHARCTGAHMKKQRTARARNK